MCVLYMHTLPPRAHTSEKIGETLMFVDCKEEVNKRLEVNRKGKTDKTNRYWIQGTGGEIIPWKNTFFCYHGKKEGNYIPGDGKQEDMRG